jgi:hypothetical protein
MGWRYRKSVRKGPFRFNFSKRGMGTSVGTRTTRLTQSPTGERRLTFTLPGTGLSWQKVWGRRRRAPRSAGREAAPPPRR